MNKVDVVDLVKETDGALFWQNELPTALSPLDLPLDFQRPVNRTMVETQINHQFSTSFYKSIPGFVTQKDLSLDQFIFTLITVFIHRFSRQSEFVMGWAKPDGDVVPIYLEIQEGQTFHDLYSLIDQKIAQLSLVQPNTYKDVIDLIGLEKDPARPSLVEVLFSSSSTASEKEPFDISFEINHDQNHSLAALVTFNGSIFNTETIQRWCDVIEIMSLAVVTDSWEKPIGQLPVMSGQDKQKVLYEWNQTEVGYLADELVDKLFEQQVLRTPNAPAIVSTGGKIKTFEELNQRANQIAHYLVKQGVKPGQAIGISLLRSEDLISTLIGVLKAGCFYVALDPNYPNGRLQFMISNSEIETLISTTEIAAELLTEDLQDVALIALDRDQSRLAEMGDENLGIRLPPASPLYILYTSGSTGVPKGVVGHHRSAINRLNWMWRNYPFIEDEVYPQKTTLNFVDSIWEIWGPLLKGVPLLLIPDDIIGDPQQFVPILEQHKIHRMIMVPSILKILLDDFPDLGERLTNLKYLTFSGEPVSIDLYNTFKRAVPDGIMLNLYGASECAADGSFCDDNIHPFDDRVPIGRPIDNTKIYILDEKMEPVPIGMSGEIYISGDCIAHGYYNRPDLTAERFIQDPFSGVEGMMMFKTGDFGRYLSNSQIEYLGRSDSQVKIRGIRIELGEIEKALNKHPLVKQSIVLVKQDRLGDKALVAYLKVEPEGLDKPSAFWRSHTLEYLPSYMVPTYFVTMLEFPHTPNGKINRTELPDPTQAVSERQNHDSDKEDKLDLDDVDLKMLEIWCEILKIDHVYMDDDFFDLGGHSVLAVQLFKKIEDMFGVRLDLTLILEHASPAKLAHLVRKPLLEKTKFEHLINLNSGTESLPSLYCVHGAGGNILFLRDWFKYLDKVPLWAFKSAGVDGSTNLPESIEEISQNYVEELLQVQPEGPYWLCGYSVGGIIALEMAHQLAELGHSVAHIFLIDTLHPQVIVKKTSVVDVLKKVRLFPYEIGNLANRLTDKLSSSKSLPNEAQAIQEHVSNGDLMPIELREGFLYSYFEDIEKKYHPKKPYKGNVTLFRAMQIWEMYSHVAEDGDWGDLLPNLSVRQVEGDHFTVVNKPGIEFILAKIKEIITR